MGVYNPRVDMPINCGDCFLKSIWGYGFYDDKDPIYCPVIFDEKGMMQKIGVIGEAMNERHQNCPLIEVKTPHGRLIDADVLKKTILHHLGIKGEEYLLFAEKAVFGNIDKAPTVIEAEGAG